MGTLTEAVEAFLHLAGERPDVASEFIAARELWQKAHSVRSPELAAAAGAKFAEVVHVVAIARRRPVDELERDALRQMVQSPITPAEALDTFAEHSNASWTPPVDQRGAAGEPN